MVDFFYLGDKFYREVINIVGHQQTNLERFLNLRIFKLSPGKPLGLKKSLFFKIFFLDEILHGHKSKQTRFHGVPFFQIEVLQSTSSWPIVMGVELVFVKI